MFPTRHTLSGSLGVDAAALWLRARLEKTFAVKSVSLERWVEPRGPRVAAPTSIANVVARIPGTRFPTHWIVVSGHYDSRVTDVMNASAVSPGANDDASGVAVVLEVARVLALSKPAIGIICAALTGEEQGLLGAKYLVKQLREQGQTVVAMATYDIVGNSVGADGKRRTDTIRVFSGGDTPGESQKQSSRRITVGLDADSPSRTLARSIADVAQRYMRRFRAEIIYRQDRFGRGGDHSPFHTDGSPAVRFTEPSEDWSHQHQDVRIENTKVYGDLPEYVDYAYLTSVTRLAVAWVAETAHGTLPLGTVDLAGDLATTTTLTWNAIPTAIGYEVLIRKSTIPTWQDTVVVRGNGKAVVTVTLPFSKDDNVFGVRCVTESFGRSFPVIAGRS